MAGTCRESGGSVRRKVRWKYRVWGRGMYFLLCIACQQPLGLYLQRDRSYVPRVSDLRCRSHSWCTDRSCSGCLALGSYPRPFRSRRRRNASALDRLAPHPECHACYRLRCRCADNPGQLGGCRQRRACFLRNRSSTWANHGAQGTGESRRRCCNHRGTGCVDSRRLRLTRGRTFLNAQIRQLSFRELGILEAHLPRRAPLGSLVRKGLGGGRRPTQVRRGLGPQVLNLLRCALAAENLVAVRVATKAHYHVAGCLGLRNLELGPRPAVRRHFGRFFLSMEDAALLEG